MKRTSTFSDGNNNMKDLTFSSLSQKNTSDFVLGSIVMLVGKIYKKIYAFAAQPSGGEFISSEQSSAYQNENPVLVEQNRNPIGLQENLLANTSNNNSPAAPFHSSILYPQNVKQMNFFTYLRRAFESSESTLKSHELKNTFLRPFRDLLSVIVGLTSDVNFLPDLSGKNTYALSLSSKTRSSFNKFSGLLLSGLFMVFAFGFSARAQNPHLKLKKTIVAPQAKYAIGDEVVYNVKINNKGNAQATGVEVTDNLPAGVQFVSTSIVRGSGGYSDATKIWSVGTLVNGDSAIIEIKTKVIAQGVWFNVAEVTHENEIDQASTPNNHVLTEDDQDAVCFTVPLYIYDGEEYAVGLPAGYTNTTWYKDGSIITPSTQGAFVRNDSLFITAAGIYNFTTSVSNCPANGCCNIIVENGPCQNAPTVAITPVAPVCAGDVINLTATIGGSATGVNWSSSSSGTSGFTSTTGLTTTYTPSAADTTAGTVTFTVITDDPDGPNGLCTPATATRTVIINKKPNPILAVTNVGNNCPSVTANLVPNVTASTPGGVIEFHTSNDTTRASLVSNATAVSGGTYYVFEISSSKCVSIGKPITVTITPCNCANPATIVISPVSPICAGGLINLTATKGGGASTLTWSTNGTGSFSTSTLSPTIYTPSQADITSGSVSFTVTTDDPDGQSTLCNAATAAVSVVINAKPVPVVIASRSNDCPSLTVDLNSSVTKSNAANTIEFHTSNDTTRASLVSNPASVTAGTYYVFEKSSAGCVSDGKPITVTITPCNCANPATIVISPVSPICAGGLINLVATKGGGASTLTWSTNGTGSFSTSTLSPTIYTPSQADITSGSVSFTVTTDDPDGQSTLCNAATAAVSVVINAKPVPVVIASRSNDCPSLTVDLNSSVTKSNAANTIEFHTSNDTTRASLVSNPASVTAGTYYVFEKSSAGCVSDGKPITVTITPCNCANPATIVISPVSPICAGGLINLVATKGGGASTLTWSTNGTGSFSTSTLSPTIYTPSQADITSGSVSFTVTTDDPDGQSTLCNAATAAVSVVINAKPVPVVIASRSNDCPSLTVDLNSSVTKSNAANTIEFHTSNDTTRASLVSNPASVTAGTYYVFEKSSAGCVSDGKPITVTITPCNCANPATIVISPVSPICAGGLINLVATKGGGASTLTWSTNGTGSFSTSTLSPTIYTPSQADITSGSVSFTVTTDDPDGQSTLCNAATAAVSVVINAKPVPVVIASRSNDCPSLTVDLNSSVTKSNAANTIEFHVSNDISSALVSNPASVTAGTYYVFEKSSAGCVSDGKPITVTITPCNCANPATIVISPVSPICAGGLINLVATKGGGASTLTWSTNGTGSFSTSTLSPTIYTPSQADITSGSVSFTVTTNDPDGQSTLCNAATAAVSVVINAKPVPVVIASRSNNCPSLTVDLNSSVTKSNAANTIEFHVSNDISSALVSNPASVTAGTYYVFEKSSAGCVSDGKPITVTITPCNCANPATIVISPVSPICAGGLINLTATKGGGANTLTWSTNGTGSFSTSTLSPTIYTPSQADITSGSVSFTVTTDDPDGQSTLCNAATATVSVVINKKADLVETAYVACLGKTVTFQSSDALIVNDPNQYQWYSFTSTKVLGSPVSGATGKSYTPSLAELPSTAGVYYYAVVATNGSCTATAYQKLTVNPTPELTVSDSKTICQGGSVDISATSAGNTINWYLLSSGGSPVHTSASAEIYTVSPSSNTTYYAEAVSAQTCISVRKPVVITVNPIPGTPVLAHSSINNQCPALTANLTAQIPGSPSTAGGVYEWHVSNSSTSALVSNPAAVTSGAYYLFEKSAAGCYSAPAIITVGIVPCDCSVPATVDIAPLAKVCAGSGPVQLAGTIGGSATSAKWTTSGTGTFDNVNSLTAKYTPSQADISAGSVILTLTTNKPSEELCPAAFKNIILTISPKPLPPVGIKCDPEICLGGANKLFAVSQGNTVKWYTTPTGGSSIGEATLDGFVVTPTEAKTYTYYAEAVTPDGCISDRTPLSFVVKKCYTDLAVTKSVINKKASYALGETLTYLIVAENLGPNDAKNVIVKDILPAGALAYVSSSPAGYDNTTGIWTIGDLNNTSSKTLAITVKTLKTGTIANTAEISSPDEDPDPSKHLNNTSTVTIVVEDLADLSLTKVVSNVSPNVGENITYTITVSNAGPSTATNIKVRDILPAGIDFVSSGDFTNSAGTLTASIASLAKNGSVALKFIAKVTASGKIVNMAEISQADQKDPDSTPGNANTTHEDDDDKVEINTSTVCNLPTPILACLRPEICLGDSISISATGCDGYTTTWNTGAHGASIWVKPAVNTTYTAYCESGICKSPVSYPINVKVITVSGPLLSASPSMVCAGSQSVLTATSCGGVLTWNTGEHIPQITVSPSVTTTYTATCAEYGCVSPAGNVTVVVSPKPAAPRLLCTCKTINICPGESITLTALNCDGQIKWSDGQTTTSITVTPTSDINYTATCTVNGCTSDPSAPNSIVVTPVAPPTVSVNNSTICAGGSAILKADGCTGLVTWNTGATGASIIVSPGTTTTYTATCSTISCKSAASAPVVVNVGSIVAPIISYSASSICPGGSAQLTSVGCTGNVVWSDGQTGSSITVSPSVTTVYSAKCVNGTCESGISNQVSISVGNFAAPSIIASTNTICNGGTVTLTASGCNGTVKWSVDNLTGSSITVTPTTTTTYSAICTSATCTSGKSNEVTVTVSSPGNPPTITASKTTICPQESVTLTASGCDGGTIKWSPGNQIAASITVNPSITTTYTAKCIKNGCESAPSEGKTITVTVPVDVQLATFSDKNNVCPGTSVTLTASGCESTVTWSPGNLTGSSVSVSPTATTTYTATCAASACTAQSSATITITVLPNGGTVQVLASADKNNVCPGTSVTLTASGCGSTVTWSPGNLTGSSVSVSPTTTTTYTATCAASGCSAQTTSSVTVTVLPNGGTAQVVASADKNNVCPGTSVTLTASGCGSTVTWSPGNLTGSSVSVSPTTTTTYTATCAASGCSAQTTSSVTVTVLPNGGTAQVLASSDKNNVCPGTAVTLTASGCGSTVTWSPGNLTGSSVSVSPTTTTTYTATCAASGCSAQTTSSVTVTVLPNGGTAQVVASADKNNVCPGTSVTLTASGCGSTVTWSPGNLTGSSVSVSPTATTTYTATCAASGCSAQTTSSVTVTVLPNGGTAQVVASVDKNNVCPGTSVTLTASGCGSTVTWSPGNLTGSSVSVSPTTTTTYTATCAASGCSAQTTSSVTITVLPNGGTAQVVASADKNNVCPGTSVTLTASGCGSTVTWSPGNLTGSSVSVSPTTTTTYTATCAASGCSAQSSSAITVIVLPNATKPTIATNVQGPVCAGTEVTLTAGNCNGTLLWNTGETASSIKVKPTAITSYTVKCSVNGCESSVVSDVTTITIGNPVTPSVTASSTLICTGGQVTLTASGCTNGTILWSNGKTGSTITETLGSTGTFSAVCKIADCSSPESAKVTVNVNIPGIPIISCFASTICKGESLTLTASGCAGVVKWSNNQEGTTITVSPTETTDYYATCKIGTCESAHSSVATVNVGLPAAPQVKCSNTLICAGTEVTLSATGCSGTTKWNTGDIGATILVAPNVTTTYYAVCKTENCESPISNKVTVTVGDGLKTPVTTDLVNVCPFKTVDLASAVTSLISTTGGVFEFHTGISPTSPLVSNPNAVAVTGTYYVFEKSNGSCYSSPAAIHVYINSNCTTVSCITNPATVNAGPDLTTCAEKLIKLNATFGGAATSIKWTSTGTGTFDNPLSPTATYRSSLADVIGGTVKLIATTNDPDGAGSCKAASDTLVFTMTGIKFKPLVDVTGQLNLCGTDSVVLTAKEGYQYKWYKVGDASFAASTRSIVVRGTSGGSYYYKLVDPNKCCSIESDTIKVKAVLEGVTIPQFTVKNGTVKVPGTIDLTTLILGQIDKSTIVFKTSASATSPTIANPKAVGVGTYYAFVKVSGCLVGAQKIEVLSESIKDADVVVTITTNKSTYAVNDTVTTTINVKNLGLGVAKGINVQTTIPGTVVYLSSTGGLVKNGNVLSVSIDSLLKDKDSTYTYKSIVNGTGLTNFGASVTTTSPDPNTLNNTTKAPATFNSTGGSSAIADLQVTILTNKVSYALADTVTTTITVKNNGPATAKNVKVISQIPGSWTYVSSTGGLVKTGNSLTGALDSLKKDSVKVYVYKAVINNTGQTQAAATVSSDNVDNNLANNTSQSQVINSGNTGSADVAITITSNKDSASVDSEVIYTISIVNNGPSTAKNVKVTNLLSADLEFVATTSTPALSKTGDTLSIKLDSLVNGATGTYSYKAKLKKIGTITNAVTVAATNDFTLPNNAASINVQGLQAVESDSADIALEYTVDKTVAGKDDELTFVITVKNKGPKTATGIVVNSLLPKYLDFIAEGSAPAKLGDTLRLSIGSLANGNTNQYTYKAKVNKDTIIVSTVTVAKSSPADPVLSNNTASVTIAPASDTTFADLAVAIVPSKLTVVKDSSLTYTVTLTNNGAGNAKDVVLTNLLPSGLVFVSSTDFTKTGDTLKATIPVVNKGDVKALTFIAKATQLGAVTDSVAITKSSKTDIVLSNNKAAATITVIDKDTASACKLGLAMSVDTSAKQSDGSYFVTYKLIAKNFCTDTLKNVSLTDSLSNAFPSPAVFAISVAPTNLNPATHLVLNPGFNGTSDVALINPTTSFMLPGAVDSLAFVVKLTPNNNGNKKTFLNQSEIKGKDKANNVLTAKSSNGTDVNAVSGKTPLTFGLPNTRFGLAKDVDTLLTKQDSVNKNLWTVTYHVYVQNLGNNDISNIQVRDSLDRVFTDKGVVIKGKPEVSVINGTVFVNPNYTGQGALTNLLADSSKLKKGESADIKVVVKVDVSHTTVSDNVYNNVAVGTAKGTDGVTYNDVSTKGKLSDPDGDGDPSNNFEATPVTLPGLNVIVPSVVGLAKSAHVDSLANGTFNVTYTLTAINYGDAKVKNVQIGDTLKNVFNGIDAKYTLLGHPTILKGTAKADSNFNGSTKLGLIRADTNAVMNAKDTLVVRFVVNVYNITKELFENQAIISGVNTSDETNFSDLSTNGDNPDPNGDGKPTEDEKTPIMLKVSEELFIPEGFSPNGDGVNDVFLIGGFNKDIHVVEVIIYNRWGNVVYAVPEYDNANPWKGEANQGITLSKSGLPDGTYYYSITKKDKATGAIIGKTHVRYMTILR